MRAMDTSQKAEEIQIEILKKLGPEKRLELALKLFETEKKLLMEGIKKRHPDYTEKEVKFALIRLFLGDNLFSKVYPQLKEIMP